MEEPKITYAVCKETHDCGTGSSFIGKITMKMEPGKAYSADNLQIIRPCKKDEIVRFEVQRNITELEGGFKIKECVFNVIIYNEDDSEYLTVYNAENFAKFFTIIGNADELLEYLRSH
jgi:hypothetical protein